MKPRQPVTVLGASEVLAILAALVAGLSTVDALEACGITAARFYRRRHDPVLRKLFTQARLAGNMTTRPGDRLGNLVALAPVDGGIGGASQRAWYFLCVGVGATCGRIVVRRIDAAQRRMFGASCRNCNALRMWERRHLRVIEGGARRAS